MVKLDFIQNKPSIATIATTGSYTDLLNKPTISDLNGVAANRNLTINGVMYDLSKDNYIKTKDNDNDYHSH